MSFARVAVITAVAFCSCTNIEKKPFKVLIHVESDEGVPSENVPIYYADKEIGRSNAEGLVARDIHRNDGEVISLDVKCPEDTVPAPPISIVVKRTDDNRPTEYTARCRPLARNVVVVVRAENGPFLPITRYKEELGRTDASGVAHILLKLREGEAFELTLNTSGNERMRPQSPLHPFPPVSGDEIRLWNETFSVEKPKPQPFIHRHRSGPRDLSRPRPL